MISVLFERGKRVSVSIINEIKGLDEDTQTLPSLEFEAQRAALTRQQELAREVGLDHLVEDIDVGFLEKRITPLTAEEELVWTAWLPTSYTGEKRIKEYAFDHIPSDVLEYWAKLKERKIFEKFEIRTPEENEPDPALFGIRGGKRWLLARWAESEVDLISFDEIKSVVIQRVKKNIKESRRVLAMILGVPFLVGVSGLLLLHNAFFGFFLSFIGFGFLILFFALMLSLEFDDASEIRTNKNLLRRLGVSS